MRIEKCWFCSANVYPGHGRTFVRNDATVFHFCRTKCAKLFTQRKNPRKVKWMKICRQLRGKELGVDPALAFERRVRRPLIYSRETLQNTVAAIPEILALRKQREDMFIKERVLGRKEEQKERDLAFISRYERLLVPDERQARADVTARMLAKKKQAEAEMN